MRKRRIGIVGGISHESTVAFYDRLLVAYYARAGDYYYPEVIIYSLDFQRFSDLEDRDDMAGYVAYIGEAVTALTVADADFIVMAANSPHAVYKQIAAAAEVPVLSMVEVTALAAAEAGAQRLLLLGIKFTMQRSFYADVCARYGIEVVTPDEADQEVVNRLVFDDLARGEFTDADRARLLAVIDRVHAATPVDGVILGCTELPLLLHQSQSALPLYDTLDLHVHATLDYALSEPLF
jgi:aspartate racemase